MTSRRLLRGALMVSAMLVPLLAACTRPSDDTDSRFIRVTTDKTFADVIFELDFAITERNFRITGRNTIGKGLRDRGYDDFPDVEVIHFCNLENAREVLLIDPDFVAEMPCRVTVHEDGGKTIVTMILLPETHADPRVVEFSHRMNDILRGIVEFVLEED